MPVSAQVNTPTFEEYAAAAWPSLYRQAFLLSGNHADAEDLAQQTLIKSHGAWSRVSRSAVTRDRTSWDGHRHAFSVSDQNFRAGGTASFRRYRQGDVRASRPA